MIYGHWQRNEGADEIQLHEHYMPPFKIFEDGSRCPSMGKVVFEALDELNEVS